MTTIENQVTLTHRVAITTKYLPVTDHRGSRIKVTAGGGRKSLTVGWDYALDIAENHAQAVQAYLAMMEWSGTWAIGSNESGGGYVAIMVGE